MTTNEYDEQEAAWIRRMIELEAENGVFPPGGASGGVVFAKKRGSETSAAIRSRERVRFVYQAQEEQNEAA